MFEQSLVLRGERRRRPAALAISLAAQAAAIGALILVPLWRSPTLPMAVSMPAVSPPVLAALPQARSARAMSAALIRLAVASPPAFQPLVTPAMVPNAADMAAEPPIPASGLEIGGPGGAGIGLPGSGLGGLATAPAPKPVSLGPLRVGGEVQAARCLSCPPPRYPALARMAQLSGVVRLAAVIGRNGQVTALRVISGPPILAGAALRAVRVWRYRPTELNGQPVRVRTEIRITFQLAGR